MCPGTRVTSSEELGSVTCASDAAESRFHSARYSYAQGWRGGYLDRPDRDQTLEALFSDRVVVFDGHGNADLIQNQVGDEVSYLNILNYAQFHGESDAKLVFVNTRAGGSVEGLAKAARKGDGYWVSIGEAWRVGMSQATGTPTLVVDTAFGASPYAKHVLDAQPTSAEIDAAGREVVARVLPDFDMAEMELESASVQPRSACAEARWRQVIAENGFHGPGMCWVVFCWPDRAVKSLSTRDSSIPREWRRPTTVTAEEAEETARPKLGDLKGGWIEATKDFCAEAEATRKGPAWNVMVKLGPKDRPFDCVPDRSVFVDPWTGEIIHTTTWKSAAAGPAEPQAKPSGTATMPTAQPPTDADSERFASRPWLPWAGGGAAVVVLALGAGVVCARRRRS